MDIQQFYTDMLHYFLFLGCSSSLGSNVSYSGYWVSSNRVNLPPLDPFSRVLLDSMPHMPLCWLPPSLVSEVLSPCSLLTDLIVVSQTPPLLPSVYLIVLSPSLAHALSSSIPPSFLLFPPFLSLPSLFSIILSRHTSWWENNGGCWDSCHGYSRGTEEDSSYL